MQVNTKIQNPTNFFFNQAAKETDEYADKIREFTKKLINTDQCALCKNDYNFTSNIPRILIHCGHTFCTSCLQNFHKNGRVRCPMCLKLVKQIETIDRLPVNHTIFTKMAEDYNKRCLEGSEDKINAQMALFQQFEAASQMSKKGEQQNQQGYPPYDAGQLPQKMPVRIDEESGLEWCEYHYDRIKHFLCVYHRETCCRVCCDLFHSKENCNIMDIYEQEDMHGFLEDFFKKNAQYGQSGQSNAVPNDTLKNGNYPQNEMTDFLNNQQNKHNDEGYFEDEAELEGQLDDEDEFEDDDDDDEDDDEEDGEEEENGQQHNRFTQNHHEHLTKEKMN